jgi:HAMP domain-containing protein
MPNSRLGFRHWRISSKLLVVMLALSLLPLLLAAWIINASSVDALTRQTEEGMTRLGNSMALRISSALADSQGLLTMAVNDPAVAAAVTGGAAPGSESTLNTAVANLLQANQRIDTVGIYDVTGTAMAHTDPSTIGRNVAARDFIGAALAGETFTSSFRRDLVNDQPGINLSAPVRAGDAVVGAVAIHLDERFISDVFAQTLGAESGAAAAQAQEAIDVYLVDPHGIVMSQLRGQDWLGRSLGALSPEMQAAIAQASPLGGDCPADDPQCPPAERIARQPAPMPSVQALGDAVAQALASGQPASLRYCHPDDPGAPASADACRGQFFVAAFAPVAVPGLAAGSPDQGAGLFSVVVDLPEASFLGSVDRQRLLGLTIAGIMTVVAIVFSLLLARTLSRPISTLASTAGEVAADQPFVPDRIADVTDQGDEVGGLARAFSRMVLALQARLAELGAIYDIGRTISASVDLDQTVTTLAESLRSVIPYDAAEITLFDQAQGTMTLVHEVGGEAPDLPRAYPADQGLVGQLAQGREPILAAELATLPAAQTEGFAQRTWRSLRPQSYLGVPLLVRGKLVGAIELVSQAPDAFTADHRRVVETIAGQAAVAIQNAQEVQAREAQLKAQIQELRIEIDEIKRGKQVEEIVDTDYFQRLSAQAKRLRSGRSGDAPGGVTG